MTTTDTARAFFHYARSWYAGPDNAQAGVLDIVDFGEYEQDGSSAGSGASMVWYEHGPRLEVAHDGFFQLAGMLDMLSTLGNLGGKSFTPAAFCDLLTALNFADRTQTERASTTIATPNN